MTEKFFTMAGILFLMERYKEVDQTAVDTYWSMLRVSSHLNARTESYFQRMGVSHSRFKIMMTLFVNGRERGMSPASLAEVLNVKRATITGVLDTLESDAIIERIPDPEDRRGVLVRLKQAGYEWLDQNLPKHYARMAAAMQGFTEDDRTDLSRLLKKFESSMDQLYGPDTPVAEA